jgi:hypothetical protein
MTSNLWSSWAVVPIALTDTPLFQLLQPTWLSQPLFDGSWTNLTLADVENTECDKYLPWPLICELQEINRSDWTQGPSPLHVTDLIDALNCSTSFNESKSTNRPPAVNALWVVLLRFRTLDFMLSRWKPRLEASPMTPRPPLPTFATRLRKVCTNTFDSHSHLYCLNIAFPWP